MPDGHALQGGLNKRTADFPVVPVQVVGPFDGDAVCIVAECRFQGERIGHGENELTGGRYVLGRIAYREQQVLATLALPMVRAASTSCRLVVGPYQHIARFRMVL